MRFNKKSLEISKELMHINMFIGLWRRRRHGRFECLVRYDDGGTKWGCFADYAPGDVLLEDDRVLVHGVEAALHLDLVDPGLVADLDGTEFTLIEKTDDASTEEWVPED